MRPEDVPGDADRCRLCGGYHVLVVEEVFVAVGHDGRTVVTSEGDR